MNVYGVAFPVIGVLLLLIATGCIGGLRRAATERPPALGPVMRRVGEIDHRSPNEGFSSFHGVFTRPHECYLFRSEKIPRIRRISQRVPVHDDREIRENLWEIREGSEGTSWERGGRARLVYDHSGTIANCGKQSGRR